VSREVAATTPPSRPPRSWNGDGEVFGVVPLLRAEGSEEEAQVGLVLQDIYRRDWEDIYIYILFIGKGGYILEDVRPTEAETDFVIIRSRALMASQNVFCPPWGHVKDSLLALARYQNPRHVMFWYGFEPVVNYSVRPLASVGGYIVYWN